VPRASEDQRALLAFGCKIPRRRAPHHETKIIAVRPDERGAEMRIAGPTRFKRASSASADVSVKFGS